MVVDGGMTSGAQFNPDGTQGTQSITPPSTFSGPSFQG
jgi:hypothetical protein